MDLVLDTHAPAWWLEGDGRLGSAALAALRDRSNLILIPTMVLVELEFVGKKRGVSNFLRDKLQHLRESRDVLILELDEEVALAVNTRLNVHDAMIVATARTHAARSGQTLALLTRDREIAASGLVEVLW